MFFRDAKKRKLVAENPFAEVSSKSVISKDRERFITREETERILAKCDPIWKVIVSLARFGGLRTPSETLSLRWEDVDWSEDTILVISPKTAHHEGKGTRRVPLFPELRQVLTEAREIAPDGAEYVVGGNYRQAANSPSGWRNCNLRTQFERIVKRAGLEKWPRLFHALRASRETELAKDWPIHVVTSWLGNSPRIAHKHYLMVTESDFRKAAKEGSQRGTESGTLEAHFPAQHAAAPHTHSPAKPIVNTVKTGVSANSCESVQNVANRQSGENGIRTRGRL
jgi:integrase